MGMFDVWIWGSFYVTAEGTYYESYEGKQP